MEPAVLAQRFVDAFNARDEEALRALYHPNARIKRPTWPGDGDVQASLDAIRLDFGAYPDGRIEVRQLVVQARHAVVEFQFEGTNTEPLTLFNGQEVPATGRPLRLEGAIVLESDADGLVTGERQSGRSFPWCSSGSAWV
jgi:SnoaL-like domain